MMRRTNRISDEELDWAMRAALRAETDNLEPSPEVWQRVRARIENPALDAGGKRSLGAWRLHAASVIQGAVLAVLVMGIGLTYNQRAQNNQMAYPQAPDVVYEAQPRVAAVYPMDTLSIGRLNRMAQQTLPGNLSRLE